MRKRKGHCPASRGDLYQEHLSPLSALTRGFSLYENLYGQFNNFPNQGGVKMAKVEAKQAVVNEIKEKIDKAAMALENVLQMFCEKS